MSPERSSHRIQSPARRRARTGKACNFCRQAKQRCEPSEYGTNDRPCRRCVSHGLDCNLSRATSRSQSPSAGPPGPMQHHIAPPSASGPSEEPMLHPEPNVQYAQQPDSVGVPMGRWPMFLAEERQGSSANTLASGQVVHGTMNFGPLAPSIEGYHQSYAIHADPKLRYYPQGYYEHATTSNPYMTGYATQSANDGNTTMGCAVEEPQQSDDGSAGEQDAVFRPGGL